MKKMQMVWAGIAVVLAIAFPLQAQNAAIPMRPVIIQAPAPANDMAALLQQLETVVPMLASELPEETHGFYSAQNPDWPPLPGDVLGLPIWPLGSGLYVLDDTNVDYDEVRAVNEAALTVQKAKLKRSSPLGGGGFLPMFSYATNVLWLEITNVNQASQTADVILHNTSDTDTYQLLSRTNLLQPDWILGNIQYGDSGTNVATFSSVSLANPMMFFNAEQSDVILSIGSGQDAVEPEGTIPGRVGTFNLNASGLTSDLTVYYTVSGTAINDVDYTNLNGVATVLASSGTGEIDVQPIEDDIPEGTETVIITLVRTNDYLVLPSGTATVHIWDNSTTVSMGTYTPLAIESNRPPGAAAQAGSFWLERSDFRGLDTNAFDVYYQVTGTASNGVDYAFLNGVFHFAPGIEYTNLYVNPLTQNVITNLQTVTGTLLPTNTYVIDTNNQSGTVTIIVSIPTIGIVAGQNAIEPGPSTNFPGQIGFFTVTRSDLRDIQTNLTVDYLISGTASNGVDYVTLTNSVTLAAGQNSTNIYVQPLADGLIKGDETVTLTLLTTNAYDLDTNHVSATVIIQDYGDFEPVVTSLTAPIGIDYQAVSNCLVVSYNYYNGTPKNFAQIYTNLIVSNSILVTNIVINDWSGISGLQDEIKLATVKTNTGGFTNGDMYYSSGTGIGWLSANGSVSNLNWGTLTNSTVTNSLPLRGGLHMDQTGVFSNQLIVVTSDGGASPDLKGVWRIDAQAHPTLLTNINTLHLEGVTTLPNDTNKFGPWAGKIITGDEDTLPNGTIYTIATNGAVIAYDTTALIPGGIHPEDFDIIPPDQNLYGCDPDMGINAIVKLSASYLTNYVGDLLITDAGEIHPPAKSFIIHWDASITNFVTVYLSYVRRDGSDGHFEHVTFAPIDLPAQ
jgi:hypothetical protein